MKMKKLVVGLFIIAECTGCTHIRRHDEPVAPAPVQVDNSPKRTTRKTLEEQSMLGEDSGSLWVGRGQASYLFTNNNLRIIGDVVDVKLEGYPKEQIATKATVIAKLLAEILNDQRQEIKIKQEEWKKQMLPVDPKLKESQPNFLQRGLASVAGKEKVDPNAPALEDPEILLKKSEVQLEKLNKEEAEVKEVQKAGEFPIKSVVARIVEIQKDGNYKIRGETPFLIGKREYKLLVMGTVRRDEYEEKGISAEILVDPTFDIISEKNSGAL